MTAADQTPAKRCGECRLGLGVHTTTDPYCAHHQTPGADSERDEGRNAATLRLLASIERLGAETQAEDYLAEEVRHLLALVVEQAATIERGAHEAWAAGVEAAFESLDGYLADDFEAVLATNPPRSRLAADGGAGMSELSVRVAAEHTFFPISGCFCREWRGSERGHAAHVAAMTEAAVRETIAADIEGTVLPTHPNTGYRDGIARAARIARGET